MNRREITDPHVTILAHKVGQWAGVALIIGAVLFSVLMKDTLPAGLYWLLFVSGCLAAVSIPSWLVGRNAQRQFLRAREADGPRESRS